MYFAFFVFSSRGDRLEGLPNNRQIIQHSAGGFRAGMQNQQRTNMEEDRDVDGAPICGLRLLSGAGGADRGWGVERVGGTYRIR